MLRLMIKSARCARAREADAHDARDAYARCARGAAARDSKMRYAMALIAREGECLCCRRVALARQHVCRNDMRVRGYALMILRNDEQR